MFDSKLNVGRFCGSPIILTYDDRLCLKATEMPAADTSSRPIPWFSWGKPVRKVASFWSVVFLGPLWTQHNLKHTHIYIYIYIYIDRWLYMYVSSIYSGTLWHLIYRSLCAFCRVVVPTKPFTNTALYYKMLLESEPTPPATKCFWGFWWWIKSQCGSLQNGCASGLQWKIMIRY